MSKIVFLLAATASCLMMAAPATARRTAIDGGNKPVFLSGYCDLNGEECVTKSLNYSISFDGGVSSTNLIGVTGNGLLTFGGSVNFGATDLTGTSLRSRIIADGKSFYDVESATNPALTDYGLNLISAGQNNEVEYTTPEINSNFYQSATLGTKYGIIKAEWFTCREPGFKCQDNYYSLTLTPAEGGFMGQFDFIQGHGSSDVGYVLNGQQKSLDGTPFFLPAIFSAVPEPASWALMIGGFGLVGGTLRRRSARPQAALA